MRKKLIILLCLGFLIGILVGTLITFLLCGRFPPVSGDLAARLGSEGAAFLLQSLLCGLYGMLCLGGSILYDIETWSLARATLVHYLCVFSAYLVLSLGLGWFETFGQLMTVEAVMAVLFFAVWLILHAHFKAQTRQLNELLRKQAQEQDADRSRPQ